MKSRPALSAEGYDHDHCNLDALLTRVSVKDGRLVLPDGMSYRILVLPNDAPMPLEALEKIAELVKAGAAVVGPRPSHLHFRLTNKKIGPFSRADGCDLFR